MECLRSVAQTLFPCVSGANQVHAAASETWKSYRAKPIDGCKVNVGTESNMESKGSSKTLQGYESLKLVDCQPFFTLLVPGNAEVKIVQPGTPEHCKLVEQSQEGIDHVTGKHFLPRPLVPLCKFTGPYVEVKDKAEGYKGVFFIASPPVRGFMTEKIIDSYFPSGRVGECFNGNGEVTEAQFFCKRQANSDSRGCFFLPCATTGHNSIFGGLFTGKDKQTVHNSLTCQIGYRAQMGEYTPEEFIDYKEGIKSSSNKEVGEVKVVSGERMQQALAKHPMPERMG
ncbi:hypothetical protein [uncultured Endozoicomonas sp.]|uniref:hypothetical protein n=1 Tax=uncultured Endozoicomonas sp. TaxID=432652 RepID=UPI00260BA89C|nr:hypothetical protein [uncultured Endozoicomonas sp.]